MKKIYLLVSAIIITLCFGLNSHAQNEISLQLINGSRSLTENVDAFIRDQDIQANEIVNGHYYRIIQFREIPNASERYELKQAGIQLMGYLPQNAYLSSISTAANLDQLRQKDAVAIVPISTDIKLSERLYQKDFPTWAVSGDDIILNAVYFQDITKEEVTRTLEANECTIMNHNTHEYVQFKVKLTQLESIYNLPHFYFFESKDKPGEPEGYEDVANHRSHLMNKPSINGLNYTGAGVTIMMQDDGPIGPHIDYEGRISTHTQSNLGDHGDHVAGIIMGAGNLDPDGVGNAPGANLMVYSSSNSNYGYVPIIYDTANVVITSKSYGNGENTGYTTLARSLDQQSWDLPHLIHVFSAGNSGTENYGYGAGSGWGNITGGHKQAKNVLAVGNVTNEDDLANSSSRGPAKDGRIKPDICAVGTSVNSTIDVNDYDNKTGTSMACPAIAGSLALLYEAYRAMNNGEDPNAALINAAVLNTADDIGNPGPDFKHGWGRINTKRAHDVIAANQYQSNFIELGNNNTHSIDVPEGTKQLRVMVYWTDYPAFPFASVALINDINISLSTPDNTTYEPWVLDHSPSASALDADAQRGIDDRNNVEQVTLDNPVAGTYTLNVNGFNIPQGPQEYYVVYEFIEDDIELTYPVGKEGFIPFENEIIRWEAFGDADPFTLEYSLDAGANWELIADNVPGDARSYSWLVPIEVTDQALVRITRGNQTDQSEDYFSIMSKVGGIQVEWACPNSFNISWSDVPGATGYVVYLLGDKFMDSVAYVEQTNASIYANSMETQWVSVSPVGPNGGVGKRAYAVQKTPGVFGCTLSPPEAEITVLCNQVGSGSCIRYMDASLNAGQGAAWEWSFPGGNPSTSTLEQPVICYDNEGFYDVSLIVKNGVGEDTISYTQFVEIKDGEELPFSEDFEDGVIPAEWTLESNGNNQNWKAEADVSAYEQGYYAATLDNFNADGSGINRMITPNVDLSSSTLIYALTFDLAYTHQLDKWDTLYVYATNDCGNTKTLLYQAGGAELASAGASNSLFVPTEADWRREVLSLADFQGNTSVSFIFENHSGQGNVLAIDNINVAISNENFGTDQIKVFPNPFTDVIHIAGVESGEETRIQITNNRGQLVYESEFTASGEVVTLKTSHLADGMYVVKVIADEKVHTEKVIKGVDE